MIRLETRFATWGRIAIATAAACADADAQGRQGQEEAVSFIGFLQVLDLARQLDHHLTHQASLEQQRSGAGASAAAMGQKSKGGRSDIRLMLNESNRHRLVNERRQEALDRRTLLGAGLRYEIVQRDSVGLAFGVTPMFEYEVLDEALGGSQDAVGRVSTYVAGRATLPNGTAFTLVSYVQPRARDLGDLRVLTQASLDVGLTRYLKLRVRTDLRYDSRPPEGIETIDLRLENGVVIVIPGS